MNVANSAHQNRIIMRFGFMDRLLMPAIGSSPDDLNESGRRPTMLLDPITAVQTGRTLGLMACRTAVLVTKKSAWAARGYQRCPPKRRPDQSPTSLRHAPWAAFRTGTATVAARAPSTVASTRPLKRRHRLQNTRNSPCQTTGSSIALAHKFDQCLLPRIADSAGRDPDHTNVSTAPSYEPARQVIKKNGNGLITPQHRECPPAQGHCG
jgi:hypothetical protein